VAPPRPERQEIVLGRSVEGRPIVATVIGARGVDGGAGGIADVAAGTPAAPAVETVLLFGAIHGDEPLTAPLLERFLEEIERDPLAVGRRRVVVVPAANPDGLARRTRENARGVDLNRNFPAASWKRRGRRHGAEPASEPETRALIELIERVRPARILSVHSALHCVNYDGPARALALAMADACGYPVAPTVGYPTPGSFGSWAGVERQIPAVTLELRESLRRADLWRELGGALLTFVEYP
jgi:protein MpaA